MLGREQLLGDVHGMFKIANDLQEIFAVVV
jgi:hypothetical protein